MTDWGGYNNHLRVGIDWSISPASPSSTDTTVDVTWKFYVGSDGWAWSDTQTLHEGADGWGGTTTGYSFNTSGSKLVDTVTRTYPIAFTSAGGSGNVHANANVTGAYNGATPSNSVSVALPDRPASTPDAPTLNAHGAVTTTSFVANWTLGANNGGTRQDVDWQVDDSSGFTSLNYSNAGLGPNVGTGTATGLSPGTKYYYRVRSRNTTGGYGPWSVTGNATTNAVPPSTPNTPTVGSKTSTSLPINWVAPANGGSAITSYRVELSTSPILLGMAGTGFTTVTQSFTGLGTNHTFTGLTANTTYYVHILATNSAGSSTYSSTLTTATPSTAVYTDTGDYVTLVNNLAQGVASKLAHLGTFIFRGQTGAIALASATTVWLDPQTGLQTCPLPDPPTYSSDATSTGAITINYPGTYTIEFMVGLPGNVGTASSIEQFIDINAGAQSSTAQGGVAVASPWSSNQQGAGTLVTIVRSLSVGDTIAFGVRQVSGGSVNTSVVTGSDLRMYCRVTMIGF